MCRTWCCLLASPVDRVVVATVQGFPLAARSENSPSAENPDVMSF